MIVTVLDIPSDLVLGCSRVVSRHLRDVVIKAVLSLGINVAPIPSIIVVVFFFDIMLEHLVLAVLILMMILVMVF